MGGGGGAKRGRGGVQLDPLKHLGRNSRTDRLFARPRISAWCRDGVTEPHTLQPRYLLRAPIDSGICNIDYQPPASSIGGLGGNASFYFATQRCSVAACRTKSPH